MPETQANQTQASETLAPETQRAALTDRAILRIEGPEARAFLQGLVSNDVDRVTPERSLYATLLTPQGKFLFDFMIVQQDDGLLLDTGAARAAMLLKRLTLYKLRAKATITDVTASWSVHAVFPAPGAAGATRADGPALCVTDPRHGGLGLRVYTPAGADLPQTIAALREGTATDYARHRFALGVPVADEDLIPEASFLLESDVEDLNGIDFKKGCYVGQELTARTKHRGAVRKRILPLDLAGEGAVPAPGSIVEAGGREIGAVTSGIALADGPKRRVLALMRLDRLGEAEANGAAVNIAGEPATVIRPDWLNLPDQTGSDQAGA